VAPVPFTAPAGWANACLDVGLPGNSVAISRPLDLLEPQAEPVALLAQLAAAMPSSAGLGVSSARVRVSRQPRRWNVWSVKMRAR
jgi:hypothetical protein